LKKKVLRTNGRHTWYLTGEMILLALFSSFTFPNTKTAIVQKILKTNCPETLSLKKPIFLGLPRLSLQANKTALTFFVTPASLTLFKALKLSLKLLFIMCKARKNLNFIKLF
jgi:hypothetical protein